MAGLDLISLNSSNQDKSGTIVSLAARVEAAGGASELLERFWAGDTHHLVYVLPVIQFLVTDDPVRPIHGLLSETKNTESCASRRVVEQATLRASSK